MKKRLFIETHGCQMNELDSELVVAALRTAGYELADSAEGADLILFNTCSIREQVENKIYSALGRLRDLKRRLPETIIGVLGCMAQKDQARIFQRVDYVDFVCGPGQLHQVPRLVDRVAAAGGRHVEVSLGRKDGSLRQIKRSHESFDPMRDPVMRPTPYQAYLRVQIGCDKFCAYCVVPSVRGPEQCRPAKEIVAEARALADQGCVEITLLGQTVNSYRHKSGASTSRLEDLLERLHEIAGVERLKFVTSYPRDVSDSLLAAVRDLPKVSPYLHVPAQSGSTAVLRRMKRNYTANEYRELIARIRAFVVDAAISSDFIVGYCGETEADFQQSADLIRQCRFKSSFIFKYNQRPGTKGAELHADDVPLDVKRRRNTELLAVQDEISRRENEAFIGRTADVLVEGPSKTAKNGRQRGQRNRQLTGRTHCDRIVVFDGEASLAGRILPVVIHGATAHTLFGQLAPRVADGPLHTLHQMG